MNNVDQLVEELRPNGVAYFPLGELLDYEQPSKYLVKSVAYNDSYSTPVLTAGQTFILGYTDEADGIYPASVSEPVVIFDDFTTSFKWVDFSFKAKSSAMKILVPKAHVNLRYVWFAMQTIGYKPQDHARQWIGIYSKFRIPVPPLPVQQEIVRKLDMFTQLEAELEAELEARKKQYSYYAGGLLEPKDGDRKFFLGQISKIVRGASPRPIRSFVTEDPTGTPWIKIGDVPDEGKYVTQTNQRINDDGVKKSRLIKPGDFILSNSMSFGRPYISKIAGCIHDGWLSISQFEETLIPDYLYYLLRSSPVQAQFSQRAGSSTVRNLNADIVKAVVVSVPSLEEQRRIVEILNNFDSLTNDLYSGLPAEIAARRKQYEYYRDKLLTFKELSA